MCSALTCFSNRIKSIRINSVAPEMYPPQGLRGYSQGHTRLVIHEPKIYMYMMVICIKFTKENMTI